MTGLKAVILILKMEDGQTVPIDKQASVMSLISAIKRNDVETIIVGEIKDSKDVPWEKQFNAVDVVPIDFGKSKK